MVRNSNFKRPTRFLPFAKTVAVDRFIFRLLIESRLFVVFYALICDNVLPDHITDQFQSIDFVAKNFFLDRSFLGVFSFAGKWDARHFLHIARFGYTFENNVAFFPFYPLLVRYVGRALWYPVSGFLSLDPVLLFTGVALNFLFFLVAAYALFYLTLLVFSERRNALDLAMFSTILFALNPATIFFTVAYTESLYAVFTFLGLYFLYKSLSSCQKNGGDVTFSKHVIECSAAFGLAVFTRSNGLLNFGYVAYALCCLVFDRFSKFKGHRRISFSSVFGFFAGPFLLGIICFLLIAAPYLYFQLYIYKIFCLPGHSYFIHAARNAKSLVNLAKNANYVLPGQISKLAWCNFTLPLSYGAVQSKNWGVGFLGYFQLSKIPLFFLASPTLILAIYICLSSLTDLKLAQQGFLKGLFGNQRSMMPFVAHTLILCILALCFINVEVVTRLLYSSVPLVYWHLAQMYCTEMVRMDRKMVNLSDRSGVSVLWSTLKHLWCLSSCSLLLRLALLYFLAYILIGTALHVNFLPWT